MTSEVTHIPLGPLDHIAPWNIPQSVIYLSLKQGVRPRDAFAHLQEGLRRTFLQVPWLIGQVHWQSRDTPGWRSGQLEIRYNSSLVSARTPPQQLRFNELDTPMSYTDFRENGFPLDIFEDEALLWTTPFTPDFEAGAEVFAAQANFLSGGCLLVLSVSAPTSDGTAMLTVTRLWADHCSSLLRAQEQGRDAVDSSSSLLLPLPSATFDRVIVDRILRKEGSVRSSLATWRLVGIDSPKERAIPHPYDAAANVTAADGLPAMKPSVFYLPHAAYTALRKKCVAEFGAATNISGNDLICALIWRSIARAWMATKINQAQHNDKDEPDETLSELAILFDARPYFAQPSSLPGLSTYLGNLNFENRLSLPLKTLTAPETSISCVARTIRKYAEIHADSATMTEAYSLLRSTQDYNSLQQLRAPRMSPALRSVGILSPMVLPFNETCFGDTMFGNDGKPEAFRPLMGACNRGFRTCFVIPRKKHGGLEFVMTLSENEMEFLGKDDEFQRYAFALS